jgi:hypothetical protein
MAVSVSMGGRHIIQASAATVDHFRDARHGGM